MHLTKIRKFRFKEMKTCKPLSFFLIHVNKQVMWTRQNYCKQAKMSRSKRITFRQWTDTKHFPVQSLHMDQKGPNLPASNGAANCLVADESFSRFLQVHPMAISTDIETVFSLEKIILRIGIRQRPFYDKGRAFLNKDFFKF